MLFLKKKKEKERNEGIFIQNKYGSKKLED